MIKATLNVTYVGEDPHVHITETHTCELGTEMEEFLLLLAEKQKWNQGLGGDDDEQTEADVAEVLASMGYKINIEEEFIETIVPWFEWDPTSDLSPRGYCWIDHRNVDPENMSVVLERI